MYQFIIGSLLSMELRGDRLVFNPCFPLEWPSVTIEYRYRTAIYKIRIFQLQDHSASRWSIGDEEGSGNVIRLIDDGLEHEVEVYVRLDSIAPQFR